MMQSNELLFEGMNKNEDFKFKIQNNMKEYFFVFDKNEKKVFKAVINFPEIKFNDLCVIYSGKEAIPGESYWLIKEFPEILYAEILLKENFKNYQVVTKDGIFIEELEKMHFLWKNHKLKKERF